jgi:hypothetical protein
VGLDNLGASGAWRGAKRRVLEADAGDDDDAAWLVK